MRLKFKHPSDLNIAQSDTHRERILKMIEFYFGDGWSHFDKDEHTDLATLRQVIRNCSKFRDDRWQEIQHSVGQIRNKMSHRLLIGSHVIQGTVILV